MTTSALTPTRKKKTTVGHTRAIQRDRSKRPPTAPADEQIAQRLTEIIHPATLAQVHYYHQLGLRERVLTLPIMVGLVLSLLWRQLSGVSELVRVIHQEVLLWVPPLPRLSQQALAGRLRSLPAELFERVLQDVLPALQVRWQARQRPLPAEIAWAQAHYTAVLACDGSTLDALVRKVGLLREAPQHPLAGRMLAVLDLASQLPRQVWYEAHPQANDQSFWPRVQAALPSGSLVVFDLGFTNFRVYAQLSQAQVRFITRAKTNLVYQVERELVASAGVRDRRVWIGTEAERQPVRLIEVLYRGQWYRYLTNELDLARLPTAYAVALYRLRWRIEDAYALVKRLLGLAYFWGGAQNAVELQLWATWLLYAVLVDLTDAIADIMQRPYAALSLEMVYRSLYFFTQAYHRGETQDPVDFLAGQAQPLGILKRPRKSRAQPTPLQVVLALTAAAEP